MPPSQRKLTYGMPHAARLALDRLLRLLLRADEQHAAAVGDVLPHEPVRGVDAVERLVQVDDVDPVALTEDETPHLRVPAPGLVTEMDSGLQQLLHAYDGHGRASLRFGLPSARAPIALNTVGRHLGFAGVLGPGSSSGDGRQCSGRPRGADLGPDAGFASELSGRGGVSRGGRPPLDPAAVACPASPPRTRRRRRRRSRSTQPVDLRDLDRASRRPGAPPTATRVQSSNITTPPPTTGRAPRIGVGDPHRPAHLASPARSTAVTEPSRAAITTRPPATSGMLAGSNPSGPAAADARVRRARAAGRARTPRRDRETPTASMPGRGRRPARSPARPCRSRTRRDPRPCARSSSVDEPARSDARGERDDVRSPRRPRAPCARRSRRRERGAPGTNTARQRRSPGGAVDRDDHAVAERADDAVAGDARPRRPAASGSSYAHTRAPLRAVERDAAAGPAPSSRSGRARPPRPSPSTGQPRPAPGTGADHCSRPCVVERDDRVVVDRDHDTGAVRGRLPRARRAGRSTTRPTSRRVGRGASRRRRRAVRCGVRPRAGSPSNPRRRARPRAPSADRAASRPPVGDVAGRGAELARAPSSSALIVVGSDLPGDRGARATGTAAACPSERRAHGSAAPTDPSRIAVCAFSPCGNDRRARAPGRVAALPGTTTSVAAPIVVSCTSSGSCAASSRFIRSESRGEIAQSPASSNGSRAPTALAAAAATRRPTAPERRARDRRRPRTRADRRAAATTA